MTVETGWWRVHFRKNSVLVHGQAELDRLKARKVPKVVAIEVAQLYECSVCHKREAWGDTWCWYGSYADLDEGRPVVNFCSSECRATAKPDTRPSRKTDWRNHPTTSRHRFDAESYRSVYLARQAANPRRFPMPVFPKDKCGGGWCRWCGEEIINRSGKRKGERSKLRNWHRRSYGDPRNCASEWMLHTNLDAQRDFLIKRDGPHCQICGPGSVRWVDAGPFPAWMRAEGNWIRLGDYLEVDHCVELWEVADLPDDERREYFGPENLWLLCQRHHKAKTAEAAARRAKTR